ncbi:MAG: AAA-like domain-containing protein [Myxococcales bacterium]|nr:AAA-like domain-containing protein [Myxococcales bacterium]
MVELQPKLREALALFCSRSGQLITRDELLDTLWPDVVVNEEALTQLIKKLRRALDDDAREPRFLQTVLKRGYRFLHAVPVGAASGAPPRSAAARAASAFCQPPRAAFHPDWYAVREAEERRACEYLAVAGMPVVLVGPERFGKTWMLRSLLRRMRADPEARVVLVRLDLLDTAAKSDLDPFLRAVALQIAEALGAEPDVVAAAWARSPNPKANLNWLLERQLLAAGAGAVVIAIDRADAVLGKPYQDEFFGLLRAWAENGAEGDGWARLRLMLAISSTPALLVVSPTQSPFNLTDPIRLSDLGDEALGWLASKHGLSWSSVEIERLRAVVGGHPYLSRVVMYAAREAGGSLDRVLGHGGDDASAAIFDDYVAMWRERLARQPGLFEAFARVASGAREPAPNDPAVLHRLLAAGLVQRDDSGVVLRYPIHARIAAG